MRLSPVVPFLLLALFTGCHSPTESAPGHLAGELNGAAWAAAAEVRAGPADGPVLFAQTRSATSFETLGFNLPLAVPGVYPIEPGGGWLQRGPLHGDAYTAVGTGGTIVILEADAEMLRGTVEITFQGPGEETIVFTDGYFEVPLGRRLY